MEKSYKLINKEHGARIECTEKYLVQWFARGFEFESLQIKNMPVDEGE